MTDLKNLLAGMLLGIPAPAWAQNASVMIVGVAHLVARRDVHNAGFADDPLSPKRQARAIRRSGRDITGTWPVNLRFRPTRFTSSGSSSRRAPATSRRVEDAIRGREYSDVCRLLRYLNTDAAIRANASFYSVVDTLGRETYNTGAA